MNHLLIFIFTSLILAGCATPAMPEPSKLANSNDPEWIQLFDQRTRSMQVETVNSHTGGFDSKFILWQNIECLRKVRIAQARAAHILATDEGIPISSAHTRISSDPRWIVAQNSCR